MNATLISILTFTAVASAVGGAVSIVYNLFFRQRWEIRQRLDSEFRSAAKTKSPLFKNLDLLKSEQSLVEPDRWTKFQMLVEQSALPVTATRLLEISGLGALVLGLVLLVLSGNWLLGLGGAAVGLAAPLLFVLRQRAARINQLCTQLPEAFAMMSRAIKAGQTVQGAFRVVASDFESPLAEEFAYCHEQQSLGLPQDVALRELARRTGVVELQMLVVALLVHRQTGANPVQLLDNLASVVRKRVKLKGKVKALTGQGRMQAIVLLLLPPLLLVTIYLLNRDYGRVLWERPQLLWCLVVSEAIGAIWIRRIVNFDY